MVKIDPFYALKKKFENHQHFFQPLLNADYQKDGEPIILLQFENQLKKADIVFYPSAGNDINDMIYFNSTLINKFSNIVPNVFFHSDVLNNDINYIENDLTRRSFKIMAKFRYYNEDNCRFIHIYKLKHEQREKLIWFVYFNSFYNEEVINLCIHSKLKTKFVYSYSDGIISEKTKYNARPIPTIFFPFIAEKLGIESIITEIDANCITKVITESELKDIQNWLLRTNTVAKNDITQTLLEIKEPPKLRNKIIEALTRFEEYPIEEIEHPKLVIKKIS